MNKVVATLKNKNTSLGLCIALAVYVAFMSGNLPEVSGFLRSNIGKLVMSGVIVFVSQHNVQLAIMLALVFVTQVNEGFDANAKADNEAAMQAAGTMSSKEDNESSRGNVDSSSKAANEASLGVDSTTKQAEDAARAQEYQNAQADNMDYHAGKGDYSGGGTNYSGSMTDVDSDKLVEISSSQHLFAADIVAGDATIGDKGFRAATGSDRAHTNGAADNPDAFTNYRRHARW